MWEYGLDLVFFHDRVCRGGELTSNDGNKFNWDGLVKVTFFFSASWNLAIGDADVLMRAAFDKSAATETDVDKNDINTHELYNLHAFVA